MRKTALSSIHLRQLYSDEIDIYFAENLSGNCNLAGLAHKLGFSQSHTRRLISGIYSKGFAEMLVERRLAAALQTISEHHNISLVKIAQTVGFSSYSGFSRAFKNNTGMSPAEFRKHYQKSGENN